MLVVVQCHGRTLPTMFSHLTISVLLIITITSREPVQCTGKLITKFQNSVIYLFLRLLNNT